MQWLLEEKAGNFSKGAVTTKVANPPPEKLRRMRGVGLSLFLSLVHPGLGDKVN